MLFAACNTFSLLLLFASLITVCLGLFLLGFIWLGTLYASYTWVTVSHIMENFSYCLFRYFLWSSLSLSFPTIPKIWMLVHVTLSQRSLKMSSFLFILFSLFCSAAVISTILSSGSLVHSSASLILLLIPSSVLYSFLQFLCCLTLCALYIFFVEHVLYLCLQSFFQNLGSSSLSLLWIPFQCWYIAYFHFT